VLFEFFFSFFFFFRPRAVPGESGNLRFLISLQIKFFFSPYDPRVSLRPAAGRPFLSL